MATVWGNFSAAILGSPGQRDDQFYQWGGRTKDFKSEEAFSTVYRLAPSSHDQSWYKIHCKGDIPTARYIGASASAGDCLYMYGGTNGVRYQRELYQLNTKTWNWKMLTSRTGPMRKAGCGMVTYDDTKLVLFGGYGYPEGPAQPEAEYMKDTRHEHGVNWTNELHTFHLKNG